MKTLDGHFCRLMMRADEPHPWESWYVISWYHGQPHPVSTWAFWPVLSPQTLWPPRRRREE